MMRAHVVIALIAGAASLGCGSATGGANVASQTMELTDMTIVDSTVDLSQWSRQATIAITELADRPPDPQGLTIEFDARSLAGGGASPVKVRVPAVKLVRIEQQNSATQSMVLKEVKISGSTVTARQDLEQKALSDYREVPVDGGAATGGDGEGPVNALAVPKNRVYPSKEKAQEACAEAVPIAVKEGGPFLCVPKAAVTPPS